MKLLKSILTLTLSLISCNVFADEVFYASVFITPPEIWSLTSTKLFSGSAPSKAWVFKQSDDSELFASALVTEGVSAGLEGQKETLLIKAYMDAFAVSWGAKIQAASDGEPAVYCDGRAGYHLVATFGNDSYDYYGCLVMRPDKDRAATLVTWIKRDGSPDPEAPALVEATKRLVPAVRSVRFDELI